MEESARRRTEAGIGRVHDLLMRILQELDAATKAAGLSYYLTYGTAIGALRHHDFIPWDIDADVFIWGREYERLIETLSARLPEDMTLHMPEDGNGYEYLFARIGLRGIDHTSRRRPRAGSSACTRSARGSAARCTSSSRWRSARARTTRDRSGSSRAP